LIFGGNVLDIEHNIRFFHTQNSDSKIFEITCKNRYYKPLSIMPSSETQSSFCCPELKCDSFQAIYCPHIFLNDIELFPVNPKLAFHVYKIIEKNNKKMSL